MNKFDKLFDDLPQDIKQNLMDNKGNPSVGGEFIDNSGFYDSYNLSGGGESAFDIGHSVSDKSSMSTFDIGHSSSGKFNKSSESSFDSRYSVSNKSNKFSGSSKELFKQKGLKWVSNIFIHAFSVISKIINNLYLKSEEGFMYLFDTSISVSMAIFIFYYLMYSLGYRLFFVDVEQALYTSAAIWGISYVFVYLKYTKESIYRQTEAPPEKDEEPASDFSHENLEEEPASDFSHENLEEEPASDFSHENLEEEPASDFSHENLEEEHTSDFSYEKFASDFSHENLEEEPAGDFSHENFASDFSYENVVSDDLSDSSTENYDSPSDKADESLTATLQRKEDIDLTKVTLFSGSSNLLTRRNLYGIFKDFLVYNRPDFAKKKEWDINSKEALTLLYYARLAFKPLESSRLTSYNIKLLSANETYNVITLKLNRIDIDQRKLDRWVENFYSYLEAYGFDRVIGNFVGASIELKIFKGEKSYITVGDILLKEEVQQFIFDSRNFLPMVLGVKANDEVFMLDLKGNLAHVLIGGPTGGGKTWFLYNFIVWLILFNKPSEVSFIFLDPKNEATFKNFMTLPHALLYNGGYENIPVILGKVCEEGERRLAKLSLAGCNNIEAYKKKFPDDKDMPIIYVVVDELNALAAHFNDDKEVKRYILDRFDEITSKYRSAGIRMIGLSQYATSRIGGEVLSFTTKRNMLLKCCVSGDERDIEYLFGETITNLRLKTGEALIKVGTERPEYCKIPSIALSDEEAVEFIELLSKLWNSLKPYDPKVTFVDEIKGNQDSNSAYDAESGTNDDSDLTDYSSNCDIDHPENYCSKNHSDSCIGKDNESITLTGQVLLPNVQNKVLSNLNLTPKIPIEDFIRRNGGKVPREVLDNQYSSPQIQGFLRTKRIVYSIEEGVYKLNEN